MPNYFSHVWLYATLWTVACQAPLSMNSSGKNAGLGCHALLQGLFSTKNWTCISYDCCIGREVLPLTPHCKPLYTHSSSVQFSLWIESNSLQLHGLQHNSHLFITNSWNLLKLMSIKLVMSFNTLVLCHPLFFLPSIFPSIRLFSNESVLCIRWPKYWNFSFSIRPYNEYSGLISFRTDWVDFLAVQGPLKSLLQNHSSKA